MPRPAPLVRLDTPEVPNRPPLRGDAELWAEDPFLRDHAVGADAAGPRPRLCRESPGGHGRRPHDPCRLVLLGNTGRPRHLLPDDHGPRRRPGLEDLRHPGLVSRHHDPRALTPGEERGAIFVMAMTEKQGGSDLRATATRAEIAGGLWRLAWQRWFCSAPMSDRGPHAP